MALVLRENTLQQLMVAFRERFRNAEGLQLAKLSAWVLYHMDVGDIDDNAMRAVFGLTVPQWNALVKRMKALAEAGALIEDARGE